MALNATKASLIRKLSARAYSQAAPVCGTFNYQVQSTVLPNKTVVASADNESPIARVSILFRAGSRYETSDNLGTVHVLRIAAGLSTCNSSQFAITRNLQQNGAILSCTTSREFIAYTLEGTRKAIEECMPYLTDVATEQVFKPWELQDNTHRLRLDLATRPPQQRAIDLLHKAAFRRGLGNSIYISKHQLGKISSETLQHYVATNFVGSKAAVVGLGVDHKELVNYATSLQFDAGQDSTAPSKYKGGEIRCNCGHDMAAVALGKEGASAKNPIEVIAFLILKQAIGSAPLIKGGLSTSIIGKGFHDENNPSTAIAFYQAYYDTGIFGILCLGTEDVIQNVIESAVITIKTIKVTEKDINRGKNQVKTMMLDRLHSGEYSIEFIGRYSLLSQVIAPSQVAEIVDSITVEDIQMALDRIKSSPLSIGACGNLKYVPYLDDLK